MKFLVGIVATCLVLFQASLADDQATIENETLPERPYNETVPDAVTIKPPGSTEELRPNLVGLANMAIVNLPSSLTFHHVIQATREIIDGVRYELLVNARDIEKNEIICRQVIIERPWITTETGDKFRMLLTTNCTVDENDRFDPGKYEGNTVFNSSNTEVTNGDLSELEKQIEAAKNRKSTDGPATSQIGKQNEENVDPSLSVIRKIEAQILPEKTTTTAPDLSEDTLEYLSILFGPISFGPVISSGVPSESNQNGGLLPCSVHMPLPPSSPSPSVETEMSSPSLETQVTSEDLSSIVLPEKPSSQPNNAFEDTQRLEISEDSKALLDSLFKLPVVEPEHVIEAVTQKTASEPSLNEPIKETRNLEDRMIMSTEIAQTATSNAPINIADSDVHQEPNTANNNVQFEEDLSRSQNGEVAAPTCPLVFSKPDGPPVLGGQSLIPKDEQNELKVDLNAKLSQLKDGGNDITGVSKIYCATKQVVAGSLKKIFAELETSNGATRNCVIEIWTRVWLPLPEGEQITLDCNVSQEGTRTRRSASDDRVEIFEKLRQLIPEMGVKQARGEALFEEVNEIFSAKETTYDDRKKYTIVGNFKLPRGYNQICEINLVQQTNRLNILSWKCDDNEFIHSFYPSVLSIPHNKRNKEQKLFAKFLNNYNRAYTHTAEEEDRFKIFSLNLQKIKMLNEMEQGTAKYGINEFADMTAEEFSKRTGLRYEPHTDSNHIRNPLAEIPDIDLPKSFDWREKGMITQVKNQGACGSCWAFSVTGNIEGIHAIKTGKLEEYSEQELVDCDSVDHGCSGGLPDNAYKAIEEIGGLELEDEYPYKARQSKCSFNKTMSHVRVKGAIDFPKNETAMALWLTVNGPISIGINANAMQFYRGGISHPWRVLCRHSAIDHGVLIVGYGVSEYPMFNKTLPYWIVKNSWGKSWGEQGYYRVYRGDNTCGVSEMASSAVLAD